MKAKLFLVGLSLLSYCLVYGQVPVDNPYVSRYHVKGHWTDSLPWKEVTSADEVAGLVAGNGHVDSAILHNTMSAISKNGGGVLYFKAGTYRFDYDVTLYDGVIIRGADPEKVRDARNIRYSPPTKFVFPKYEPSFTGNGTPDNTAFKQFLDLNDIGFGMVNVDLNRVRIFIKESNQKNVIVFGVRSNNATDHRTIYLADFLGHGWQRYPTAEVGNIYLTFTKGVVANCKINDSITDDFEMRNFMTNEGHVFSDTTIRFQYGLQNGLYVGTPDNKSGELDLLDNDIKAYYVSEIAADFYGEKNISNNNFEFLSCQDYVTKDFYNRKLQQLTRQKFDSLTFIAQDGDTLEYEMLKPKHYDPAKKYPFVLFYHGAGQHIPHDPTIHFVHIFSEDTIRDRYPYFVVIPHIPDDKKFATDFRRPPTKYLRESVELVKALKMQYSVDENNMYVSGISSGGNAVLETLVRYPGLFNKAILMSSIRHLDDSCLEKIKNVSLIVSFGDQDVTPIKLVRYALEQIKEKGNKVDYFEYHGVGHWSWLNLCADERFKKIIYNNNL